MCHAARLLPLALLLLLGRVGHAAVPAAGGPEDPVVQQVHWGLVHLLLADHDAAARALDFMQRVDADRRALGEPDTGLADQMLHLRNSLLPSRQQYLGALRAALKADPDPALEGRIRHRLAMDELTRADRLLRDSRRNRFAKLVNDAIRPLGRLSTLAVSAVNPIFLASLGVDSVVATASNLKDWRRAGAPERQALIHLRHHVREEGATEAPRSVRHLSDKVAVSDCKRQTRRAREAAASGEAELARAHLEAAEAIPDCAAEAGEVRAELDARLEPPAPDPSLWPAHPLPPVPADLHDDYHALLVALLLANPAQIDAAATALDLAAADSTSLADEARYAGTVATDLAGRHQAALEELRALAADDDSNMGRRAAQIVRSPQMDRFRALEDTVKHHRRERVRFVLLGSRPRAGQTVYGVARAGARGLAGLQTLGLLNVINVLTRGVQNWRRDPIPNDPIIAAGEDLLVREPDSPHASATRAILADAYARKRMHHRALYHYERTEEPDAGRIAELREGAAEHVLTMAQGASTPERRRGALELVQAEYPGTKAAERAGALLAKVEPEHATSGASRATLPAEALRQNVELADRLGLPRRWLDGSAKNGEVAGEGLRLVRHDRAALELETPTGAVEETVALDHDRISALSAALSEAEHLDAARTRGEDTAAPFERFIPFYIEGTFGESGLSVVPGIKPRRHDIEQPELFER
jgi:hypothetical protein